MLLLFALYLFVYVDFNYNTYLKRPFSQNEFLSSVNDVRVIIFRQPEDI